MGERRERRREAWRVVGQLGGHLLSLRSQQASIRSGRRRETIARRIESRRGTSTSRAFGLAASLRVV